MDLSAKVELIIYSLMVFIGSTDSIGCPAGYQFINNFCFYCSKFSNSCYNLDLTLRYWNQAQTNCKARSSTLAVVETKEENKEISELIMNTSSIYSSRKRLWLGGNDFDQEGHWKWDTHDVQTPFTYTNWKSGEPDDNRGVAGFLVIEVYGSNSYWLDFSYSRKLYSVCEYKRSIDCEYSNYSEWSNCSASCGSGTKSKHRFITVKSQLYGTPCYNSTLTELEHCNTHSCPGSNIGIGFAIGMVVSVFIAALAVIYFRKKYTIVSKNKTISEVTDKIQVHTIQQVNRNRIPLPSVPPATDESYFEIREKKPNPEVIVDQRYVSLKKMARD